MKTDSTADRAPASTIPTAPRGTVTFLFTDVEGSTRLLEQFPRSYPAAIARHHAILREAVETAGGVVFETIGDAVYAAFADVAAAAHAAVAAQQGLAREAWGETGPIRVRMAIHAGEVDWLDGHYFGAALYRCARLMTTGHGGQVLASSVVADALAGGLPGTALLDLGVHRLKDLQKAERIYQLAADGLAAEFPPLRTLDVHPTNLPLLRTPFVGRERELADGRGLLLAAETRLLTLTGPGGIGKTRLALELAAQVSDAFADGIFFVPLARVDDPALVPGAIAEAVSLQVAPGRSILQALRDFVREKHVLLVLDNFEHVLGAAETVSDLLDAAPRLRVLATSREPLQLYGEREYPVPPLGVARDGNLTSLQASDAVRLFIQRARDIRPDFEARRELPKIAEICRRLDGLPLAIELAAARIRTLSASELLARLDRQLPLLTGGARDAPARQRTLRDTVAWSHALLDDSERILFRRFAIFNGGCIASDAEAILAFDGVSREVVWSTLESLAAKSLLRVEESRLLMLAVIREFAGEQLEASGETVTAHRRHAEHYLAVAAAEDERLRSVDQLAALERLDVERDNLRAALSWCIESGERVLALRLSAKLSWYWFFRTSQNEGRYWLSQVLPAPADAPLFDRVWVLAWASWFASLAGHADEARTLAGTAVDEARQSDDPLALGWALGFRAAVLQGIAADDAVRDAGEALRTLANVEDPYWRAWAHMINGEVARSGGRDDDALLHYEQSVELGRPSGDRMLIMTGLMNPAHIHLQRGDLPRAREMLVTALRAAHETGLELFVIYSLIGFAGIAVKEGDAHLAAALLAAAQSRLRRMGMVIEAPDQAAFDAYEADIRAILDEQSFSEAWQRGEALDLEEAVALATGEVAAPAEVRR